MRVLVVGSGGREHAIAWKLSQSPELEALYCAPGNPGIAELGELVPIAADRAAELAGFAEEQAIDLTVVGPELPLTLGLVDELRRRGLAAFGPTAAAAELEGSKVFAKEFMRRRGVPTADFRVVGERSEAESAAAEFGLPVVLKADGLAAGKGVLIPESEEELERSLEIFFEERRFGASGDRLLVEECLVGEEVSYIGISDGERFLPFACSKDYKRIGEQDLGPNTGGMGAHSPSGILSADLERRVLAEVMQPTIAGMAAEGRRFSGFLYAGLMLTQEGPKVLEFNARLGDPEAQPLLLRLDEDLLTLLAAGAAGAFPDRGLSFHADAAACIVLAAAGYPGTPAKGDAISGLAEAAARPGVEIFHAGTAVDGAELVTAGGRVLGVCARGRDLAAALATAYEATDLIAWDGKALRRDIGRRVVERIGA